MEVFGEDLKEAVESHKGNERQKGELEKALQEDLKPKIEAVEAHLKTVEEKEPGWTELAQKDPEEMQGIRKAADDLKVALLENLQKLASAKEDAAKADEEAFEKELAKYLAEKEAEEKAGKGEVDRGAEAEKRLGTDGSGYGSGTESQMEY